MPADKSTNFPSNVLIGFDGSTAEHYGFGRDPVTNQSTRARMINAPADPTGTIAPAGSVCLSDNGTIWLNTDGTAIGWVSLSTTASDVFLAPNEYYIDQTQAAQPAERIYPDIASAVAAGVIAFPGAGQEIVMRLRERQPHAWDLAAGGLVAASTLRIVIYSHSRDATVDVQGTAPNAGAGARVRFDTATVTVNAASSFGQSRTVISDNNTWNNRANSVGLQAFQANNTAINDPRFLMAGASVAYTLTNCIVASFGFGDPAPILFGDAASGSSIKNTTIEIAEDDFTLITPPGGGNATLDVDQVQVRANQTGAGGATLFNTGANQLRARGLSLHTTRGGAGTLSFGDAGPNLTTDSYITQSGDTLLDLPGGIQNLAGTSAFVQSIPAESGLIAGGDPNTPFDQVIVIPANTITRAGDVLRVRGRVNVTAWAAPSTAFVTLQTLGGGGVNLAVPTFTGALGFVDFDVRLRFKAVGAGGNVTRGGMVFVAETDGAIPTVEGTPYANPGFDTSIDQTLQVEWDWAASNAANRARLIDFEVDVIRAGYN